MKILLLASFQCLLILTCLGQEPDTLDPAGYFPLEVGNIWEYEHLINIPFSDPEFELRYERYTVVDSLLSDTLFYDIYFEELDSTLRPIQYDTLRVWFDTELSGLNGPELPGILYWPRCLDDDYYLSEPSECWVWIDRDDVGPNELFAEPREVKQFQQYYFTLEVLHGVGIVSSGPFCEPCGIFDSKNNWSLRFARVGGQITGAKIVGIKSHEPARLSIDVFPNPVRYQLNIVGSPADRIEVFDITGRLVKETFLNSNGASRILMSSFRTGIYLVRVGNESVVVSVL